MLTSNQARIGLSGIIRQRAREDYGFGALEPSALAAFLSERCQLKEEDASALAWGEEVELSPEDLERLASIFSLHKDLLVALLCPTSEEGLRHLLEEVIFTRLSSNDCLTCNELEERIMASAGLDQFLLTELCLDIIKHLNSGDRPHYLLGSTEAPSTILDSLWNICVELDSAAQHRVLAYAIQESNHNHQFSPSPFHAFALLREQFLTPLARDVFDQLAKEEGGQMSASDLVVCLGLGNTRSLSQLQRTVMSALQLLTYDGIELDNPLLVSRIKKERVFTLTAEATRAWRALMDSEKTNPVAQSS